MGLAHAGRHQHAAGFVHVCGGGPVPVDQLTAAMPDAQGKTGGHERGEFSVATVVQSW